MQISVNHFTRQEGIREYWNATALPKAKSAFTLGFLEMCKSASGNVRGWRIQLY